MIMTCGDISWNGLEYICLCDISMYCHHHERWVGSPYGVDLFQTVVMEGATTDGQHPQKEGNNEDPDIVEIQCACSITPDSG
jgi:hypothetical protein